MSEGKANTVRHHPPSNVKLSMGDATGGWDADYELFEEECVEGTRDVR